MLFTATCNLHGKTGNQIVCVIPFGKLQNKIWAVNFSDASFLFFFGLFSLGYTLQRVVLPPRQISKKFYVYAQGVCVDGKLPYI